MVTSRSVPWRGSRWAALPLVLLLRLLFSATSASAAVPKGFFGINAIPYPTDRDTALMAQSGVARARFGLIWSFVQSAAGYDWRYYDAEIGRLASQGIRPLPVVTGAPWWPGGGSIAPIDTLRARDGWRDFLSAAAERYGPHGTFWSDNPQTPYEPILCWQIWNEPNYAGTWPPAPSARGYARLLRISHDALRSVDSRAKIVLGALGPGIRLGYPSWRFLQDLYQAGAGPDFDIVAVNPYASDVNGLGHDLERLRAVMRRNGDRSTPLWVTELGWASTSISGHRWAVGTEAKQASLLRSSFDYLMSHARQLGLGAVFWFDWRDVPDVKGFAHFNFGLRAEDGSPKPAWAAYRAAALSGGRP